MGLYDIVLGDGHQHERGALLLGLLGYPLVGRFRDAWVERSDDGPVIAIYTRQGGPNRSDYEASVSALTRHPLYLRDRDDRYDHTYCTYYFRGPDEHREALEAAAGDPVDMSERWEAAIARVGKGHLNPAERAMADQFLAAVTDESPRVKIIQI